MICKSMKFGEYRGIRSHCRAWSAFCSQRAAAERGYPQAAGFALRETLMKTLVTKTSLVVALLCVSVAAFPADARAQASSPVAPTLIPVSGRLVGADGQPRAGQVSLLISLYNTQFDASPRWVEQQTVTLDPSGGYSVQFGSTLADGLPSDLFATEGGARWLGLAVREIEGDVEQPRVMLVSVPYAAKAATADTLGGKTASDFVLTSTFRDDLRTVLEEEGVTTGSDSVQASAVTANYLQKGTGSGTATTDSVLFESSGRIGLGTTAPQYPLHVANSAYTSSVVGNNVLLRLQSNAAGADTNIQFSDGVANSAQFGMNGGAFYITSNGSQFFRMAPNGHVGMGTASPLYPLHVVKPTYTSTTPGSNILLRLQSNGIGADANIQFSDGVANSAQFGMIGGAFYITGNGVQMFRIAPSGNIGIGTANPLTKLHVSGDVTVDGNIGAKYQDVAEWVESAEPLEPGSVVVIDQTKTNRVAAARRSYDGRVAGAVSAQPGIILGEAGEGKVLVAQSGRVRIKADAKYGAIKPGDLLVTSATKGHAMRSRPVKVGNQLVHRSGTLIGKALEALPNGKGEILVLLTLQ
jgi:hypothetical protein